jgi:hypothetical protein
MPSQFFRWTNPPKDFSFPGPEALRAYFFPRQTIQIQEAARVLGIGREAMYRGSAAGLKFSRRPGGRQFVLLDDLISYLFPSHQPENPETTTTSSENCPNGAIGAMEKKKTGRPRGSKSKPPAAQEGGAK